MTSLVLDPNNSYYEPQTQLVASIQNGNGNKKKILNCVCCPYGYHIDLDFIRYCEELAANSKPPSDEQIIRRNKRRQRKSKEFMLGFDIPFTQQFYQYQIQQNFSPIVLQLSPGDSQHLLNNIAYNDELKNLNAAISNDNEQGILRKRASSMPLMTMKENSAFVKEILFDVCSDFERTLERSLSKAKPKKYKHSRPFEFRSTETSPVGRPQYIIKQNNSQTHNTIVHIETIESKVYNKNDTKIIDLGNVTINVENDPADISVDNGIAYNNLGSEEHDSPKKIGTTQKCPAEALLQLNGQEKQYVNLKTQELEDIFSKKEQHETTKQITEELYVKRNSSPFNPQRVCAMSLDSLKLRYQNSSSPKTLMDTSGNSNASNEYVISTKSTPIPSTVHSQRDVGCMAYTPLLRSIGTLTTPNIEKEVKTVSTNTTELEEKIVKVQQGQQTDQRLFTQEELQNEISKCLEKYKSQQQRSKQLNSCTVGTQSDLDNKKYRSVTTITDPIHTPSHSVGIMAKPDTSNRQSMTAIESKSIETNTEDFLNTAIISRSVGELSTQSDLGEHPISLRSLDKFKCTSTQCMLLKDEPAKQKPVTAHSVGLQYSPKVSTKSIQCTEKKKEPRSMSESTDTKDLILLIHRSMNTDAKPKTHDRLTNTDKDLFAKKTKEIGINCDPPKKTIDIGVNCDPPIQEQKVEEFNNKLTESVSSTDSGNTCIAKVEIKQRTVISNLNKNDDEQQTDSQTRIPRPMALISPRPERKFQRQNTYTIPSPPGTTQSTEIVNQTSTAINRSTDVKIVNESTTTSNNVRCPAEEYLERAGMSSAHSSPKPSHKHLISAAPSGSGAISSPSRSPQVVKKQTGIAGESIPLSKSADSRDSVLWRTSAPSTTSGSLAQSPMVSSAKHQKAKPSKEMLAALKVINDSLQKLQHLPTNLKNANKIVQKEWFHISSTESANPLDVEDYLDCFEEFSPGLLKYVVNLSDSNGNTAMHYAVSHGNFDVVSILLDSKVCCVNQTNNAGYTCVMLVSLAKLVNPEHQTVVQRLFHLSDVNIRAKKHNQTALMLAVSHGNYDMVHMLLEAGAEINIQDEDGSTALMCAAEHGRIDIIKLLLAHPDCDSTIQDVDGSTALKISLEAGYRDIGVLLYAHEHMSRNRSPQSSIRRSAVHSSSLSSSTTNIGGTNDGAEGSSNISGIKKLPS